jgi:hypothetical protein
MYVMLISIYFIILYIYIYTHIYIYIFIVIYFKINYEIVYQINTTLKYKEFFRLWTQRKGENSNIKCE